MPVFVTSTAAAIRHGVYVIERQPPSTVRPTGTGTAAMVEVFPWGPDQMVYQCTDMGDFINKFALPGMPHTGPGYLAVTQKGWPVLKIVRVTGATKQAATATVQSAGPLSFLTLTAKYVGSAGNAITATSSAASDGDANHFNLTVTVTSATGTTTDLFKNLNYSGVGTDSAPDFSKTLLIGGITKLISAVPILATVAFSTGSDGTIVSGEYVGTAGTGNKGIALLENDKTIDAVMTADPGNSLRAAVNAGLVAHADLLTDRVAYINGNSGLSLASTQTDVANYRSIRAVYVDCWASIADDVDGTLRLVGGAPFAASVASQLSPSTSIAWKSSKVQSMLRAIVSLESPRGDAAASNTDAGIVTLNREATGGYTFEAGVVTNAPVNPAKRSLKRTRMGHYIGRSVVNSLRESTDAPNVPSVQQDEVLAVSDFLETLKNNLKNDPFNLPHIMDYAIKDLKVANSQSSLDNGEFYIPADVKISSDQEKIFLSLNYGETVKVNVSL